MAQIKEELLSICRKIISNKRNEFLSAINEIKESIGNETKSSAGDKHETARARMQFEEEKLKKQLLELNEQAAVLDKIDSGVANNLGGFASVVETDKTVFFIAISLGKIEVNAKPVYVISSASPLALKIKGLKVGSSFEFNNLCYSILKVY